MILWNCGWFWRVWEPKEWKENMWIFREESLLCHDCVCGTKFWLFCGWKPIVCDDWLPVIWVFGLVCHDCSCSWPVGFWKPEW